jgi:hypothetical protein
MSRYTELANQILTSEYGRRIYEDVAEIYGESYTSLWMMQVIGLQLDKFRKFTKEFIYQVTPETATWTIDFWEKEYGLTYNPSLTLEQRRSRVMVKMMSRTAITPYRIEQIVKTATGAECKINENYGFKLQKFEVLGNTVNGVSVGETNNGIMIKIYDYRHELFDSVFIPFSGGSLKSLSDGTADKFYCKDGVWGVERYISGSGTALSSLVWEPISSELGEKLNGYMGKSYTFELVDEITTTVTMEAPYGFSVNMFEVFVYKNIDKSVLEEVEKQITAIKPSHLIFTVRTSDLYQKAVTTYAVNYATSLETIRREVTR